MFEYGATKMDQQQKQGGEMEQVYALNINMSSHSQTAALLSYKTEVKAIIHAENTIYIKGDEDSQVVSHTDALSLMQASEKAQTSNCLKKKKKKPTENPPLQTPLQWILSLCSWQYESRQENKGAEVLQEDSGDWDM